MAIRGVELGLLVAVAAALCACRPGASPSADLSVESAWARATAPGQDSGGVFLTIRGADEADRLVGGSSEAAKSVEIHTMNMDGQVMRMRRQPAVDIPAGRTVKLAPGGTHLMLVGLAQPLTVGQSFPLTLDFRRTGRKQVTVAVRPIAATGPKDDDDE